MTAGTGHTIPYSTCKACHPYLRKDYRLTTDLREGDEVIVTFKGKVNTGLYGTTITGPKGRSHTMPQADGYTIERLAPANWPPKAGDVWRVNGEELHFLGRTGTEAWTGENNYRTITGKDTPRDAELLYRPGV